MPREEWATKVAELANMSLFPLAKSWYTGANIPGKPPVFLAFLGGVGAYRQACDDIAAAGYPGFAISSRQPVPR